MHIGLPTKFSYPLVFIQEGEKMENLISFYIFVFVIFSCLFYYYYYYLLLLLLFIIIIVIIIIVVTCFSNSVIWIEKISESLVWNWEILIEVNQMLLQTF